jgi:hypothetical protein
MFIGKIWFAMIFAMQFSGCTSTFHEGKTKIEVVIERGGSEKELK